MQQQGQGTKATIQTTVIGIPKLTLTGEEPSLLYDVDEAELDRSSKPVRILWNL